MLFRSDETSVQTGECTRQILGTGQNNPSTVSIRLSETDVTAICAVQCTPNGELSIGYNGLVYPVRVAESLSSERLKKHILANDDDTLASPMPGKVLSVLVSPKDEVAEDQPLVVIEAMKMEFTVRAPHAGRIAAVKYEPGAQVAVGDILIEMEKVP